MQTVRSVVVVTGSSRGLGEALAVALLAADRLVIGLARGRSARLGAAAASTGSLEAQHHVDLADPVAAAGVLADVLADERVDWPAVELAALVNNAGVLDPMDRVGRLDPTEVARAFALNAATPVVLADTLLRVTERYEHVERRILNITSGAARTAYPGWCVYGATKAALDHATRTIGAEAPPRCRVAAVAPGVVDTPMQAQIRAADDDAFPARSRFVAMHEQQALADPDAVAARLAAHLLGPDLGVGAVDDLRTMRGG